MESDVVGNVSKKRFNCYYWKIPDFFLQDKEVQSFRSPYFIFLDFTVTLRLTLNVTQARLIRLDLDLPDPSIGGKEVVFSMLVENSAGILKSQEVKLTFKSDGNYYSRLYPCHIDLSSFQKLIRSELLPSSALTILLSMAADGQGECAERVPEFGATSKVPRSSGTVGLARDLKGLLLSGDESDATVRVKLQEFKVHRSILAARTPVFSAMFRNDTSERASGIVDIEDSDPDTVQRFLQFLYSGGIDDLTADNATGVYEMADKYQLLELKEECLGCIKRGISVKSFCHVITLAMKHDEMELIALATDFFLRNAREIVRTVDWQVFLYENPTPANELFISYIADEKK